MPIRLGLDLGLRSLPHRAQAEAGDDLRVLDDHRHAGARHQAGQASARWSAATATATRRSTPRSPPPSTWPATAGSTPASAPAGTSTSGAPTATASPRRRSGWAMFREAVEIIHKMWTEDTPSSRASTTRSTGRSTSRKACSKPHPPLWIGGGGEQVTLQAGRPVRRRLQRRRRQPRGHPAEARDARGGTATRWAATTTTIIKSTSVNLFLLAGGADREKATAAARSPWA